MAADVIEPYLQVNFQGTGNNDNTWGEIANLNYEKIIDAICEETVITVDGVGGALSDDQQRSADLFFQGTLTGNETWTVNDAAKRFYFVDNTTTGAFDLTVKTVSGTGVILPAGRCIIHNNGTNVEFFTPNYSDGNFLVDTGDITVDGGNILLNDQGSAVAPLLAVDADGAGLGTGLWGVDDGAASYLGVTVDGVEAARFTDLGMQLQVAQGIFSSVETGALGISGGATNSTGSNIVLQGNAAANAYDVDIRRNTTSIARWDDDANIFMFFNQAGTLHFEIDHANTQVDLQSVLDIVNFASVVSTTAIGSAAAPLLSFDSDGTGSGVGLWGQNTTGTAFLGVSVDGVEAARFDSGGLDFPTASSIAVTGVDEIINGLTNATMNISGGSTNALGARLVLNGEVHANAGDFGLFDDATAIVEYDASATSLLLLNATLTGTELSLGATVNAFAICRDTNAKQLNLSGGSGISDSAELILHGSADTDGNDYHFRIAGTDTYRYDHSALTHTFKTGVANNHIVTGAADLVLGSSAALQYDIYRGVNTGLLTLFGGNAQNVGGGFVAWGGAHAGAANDFALRSGTDDIIRWDNSLDELRIAAGAGLNTQMALTSNQAELGVTTADYTLLRPNSSHSLRLSGGNASNVGGNLELVGDGDWILRADGTQIMAWDESAQVLRLAGTFSSTGASEGFDLAQSSVMQLRSSANTGGATSLVTHYQFYNGNGSVGSIRTTGSATQFNVSSDERLKQDYQDFDGLALLDQMKVYDFQWKKSGERQYGAVAQELEKVYPQAVSRGNDDPVDSPDFEPWGVDNSHIVPILIKAVQQLLFRIEVLEGA